MHHFSYVSRRPKRNDLVQYGWQRQKMHLDQATGAAARRAPTRCANSPSQARLSEIAAGLPRSDSDSDSDCKDPRLTTDRLKRPPPVLRRVGSICGGRGLLESSGAQHDVGARVECSHRIAALFMVTQPAIKITWIRADSPFRLWRPRATGKALDPAVLRCPRGSRKRMIAGWIQRRARGD
jgi:hypothetical protein